MIINQHWRVWRCYPVCLVLFTVSLLAGCGIYLHDDDLQKQTDIALSTYKTADIVGAMKSALAAQEQLNKAELLAVAEKETADRERAIADIISAYPRTRPTGVPEGVPEHAIDRLKYRVNNRIEQLVGKNNFDPKDWLDYHETLVDSITTMDSAQRFMEKALRDYRASGGDNFQSCETFQGQNNKSAELNDKAQLVKGQCEYIAKQLPELQQLKNSVLKSSGKIAEVNQALVEVDNQLIEQTKNKNEADKQLKDAKKILDEAISKDPNAISTNINAKLESLDAILKGIDAIPNDNTKQLGSKLAAVQFLKTNLRDVIAVSSLSNDNATSTPESDLHRSIVGAISGLTELNDISNPPSIPELSVALAFQDGKEKQVQAMLDALYQKQKLLQHQQDSLLHELELLAVAKEASQTAKSKSGSCNPIGFAEMFPNANCAFAARMAAARALSAYNFSWASGRTAAVLDEQKITQGITLEGLRVNQERAIARVNIETIALTEIAAFGQGGIKPETIAAFLQAIAAAAIAGGVY